MLFPVKIMLHGLFTVLYHQNAEDVYTKMYDDTFVILEMTNIKPPYYNID